MVIARDLTSHNIRGASDSIGAIRDISRSCPTGVEEENRWLIRAGSKQTHHFSCQSCGLRIYYIIGQITSQKQKQKQLAASQGHGEGELLYLFVLKRISGRRILYNWDGPRRVQLDCLWLASLALKPVACVGAGGCAVAPQGCAKDDSQDATPGWVQSLNRKKRKINNKAVWS